MLGSKTGEKESRDWSASTSSLGIGEQEDGEKLKASLFDENMDGGRCQTEVTKASPEDKKRKGEIQVCLQQMVLTIYDFRPVLIPPISKFIAFTHRIEELKK